MDREARCLLPDQTTEVLKVWVHDRWFAGPRLGRCQKRPEFGPKRAPQRPGDDDVRIFSVGHHVMEQSLAIQGESPVTEMHMTPFKFPK